jgi:hypothetical protein
MIRAAYWFRFNDLTRLADFMLQNITVYWLTGLIPLSLLSRGAVKGSGLAPSGERILFY